MIDLKDRILYEDEDILAINKPAGLVVHPDGRTKEESVAEWFVTQYPDSASVGEPLGEVVRPGVVHRIDRETSGALLLAKTHKGHEKLKHQFQERSIRKIYHAFVHGLLKEDHGSIKLPIGKSRSDFRKWSAERGAKGDLREALTYFRVLKRGENFTFVEAQPKTGRTHQIRVHFKALHHPVVGDTLYARGKPSLLGFQRLALHARSISFRNTKGEEVSLEAPYPEDFQAALRQIDLP